MISLQYPLIEAVNGVGYVVIFYFAGLNLFSILYALTFSVLVAVTVIDWRTYEIPPALNIVIAVLGVIVTVLEKFNIPTFGYTPMVVKQVLTGYGRAEKKEVEQMVKIALERENLPKLDDTVDAIAIAICHARSVG